MSHHQTNFAENRMSVRASLKNLVQTDENLYAMPEKLDDLANE